MCALPNYALAKDIIHNLKEWSRLHSYNDAQSDIEQKLYELAQQLSSADCSIQDNETGKTILKYALMYREYDVAYKLAKLSSAEQLSILDNDKETPLFSIFYTDHRGDVAEECRKIIFQKMKREDLALLNNKGFNIIHQTCRVSDINFAIDVIKKARPADLGIPSHEGLTPLMYVVKDKNIELIKVLLNHMSFDSISYVDKNGVSAHSMAKEMKHPTIEDLIKNALNTKSEGLPQNKVNAPLLIQIPDATEVRGKIKKALATSNSSEAIDLSEDINKLVGQFLTAALATGMRSYTAAIDGQKAISKTLTPIENLRSMVEHFEQNPYELWSNDIITRIKRLVHLIPDPTSLNAENFEEALAAISRSVQASKDLLKGYETFEEHKDKIISGIDILHSEISGAISVLKEDSDNRDLSLEEQRLLSLFTHMQESIDITRLSVTAQSCVSQNIMSIEVEFAGEMMKMRSAAQISITNVITMVARAKDGVQRQFAQATAEALEPQLEQLISNFEAIRAIEIDRGNRILALPLQANQADRGSVLSPV